MVDEVSGNEGTSQGVPAPAPAEPAATVQPAQPAAAPVQQVQPQQQPQESDQLGKRILLWTGKIVVAIVYFYSMLAIITIAFRFFLLLFGASPNADFSNWIYTVSARFMEPFAGMIEVAQPGGGGSYIDVSALFAIAAYAVIAWLIHMLYEWMNHRLWVAQHN